MTHTPGPWTFIPAGNRPEIVAFGDKVMVARIESLNFVEDARLIAAAPELLEILKRADEELRLIRMKDTGSVYDVMLRTDISALIAKAEDRT